MATFKLDVHHHFMPLQFQHAYDGRKTPRIGSMKLPPWSPELSLAFMERCNIKTSILSLGTPVTGPGSDTHSMSAALSREMNEYASSLCVRYPKKFGFFATLPSLEDVPGCIKEIRFALEDLKANGVSLFTSYGGKYLGHPDFQPVWVELNRLAAVIFIHPGLETAGPPIREPQILPKPLFDWTHETTRTAAHLITTDTLRMNPACRVILPHGGGTLPYIASRIAHLSTQMGLINKSAEEFLEEAKNFYFDVACAGYEELLRLLLDFAKPGHVLYGSDYPFGRENMVEAQLKAIDKGLSKRDDAALVSQDAALQLWPGFKEI